MVKFSSIKFQFFALVVIVGLVSAFTIGFMYRENQKRNEILEKIVRFHSPALIGINSILVRVLKIKNLLLAKANLSGSTLGETQDVAREIKNIKYLIRDELENLRKIHMVHENSGIKGALKRITNISDKVFRLDDEAAYLSDSKMEEEIWKMELSLFQLLRLHNVFSDNLYEKLERNSSGSFKTFLIYDVPLLFVGGFLVFFLVRSINRNISAQHEAEERVQNVMENIADGIITIDAGGYIESANPATGKMFGYAADEIPGMNINKILPEPENWNNDGYVHSFMSRGSASIIGQGTCEAAGLRRDGELFPIDLVISEAFIGEDNLFIGVVRDITARKNAEAEIQELNENLETKVEERTRELAAKSAQITKLNEINREMSSVLDLDKVLQNITQATMELIPGIVTNLFIYEPGTKMLIGTVGMGVEMEAGGLSFSLENATGIVGWACKNRESVFIKDVTKDHRWEEREWTKNYTIGAFAAMPLIAGGDIYGAINCFIPEVRDWTEEEKDLIQSIASQAAIAIRNARLVLQMTENNREIRKTLQELKEAQGRLIQSEKMASLGQLVAGVAHEVNTPIGVGLMAASHFQEQTRDIEELYKTNQIKKSSLESFIAAGNRTSSVILENLRRAAELVKSFKQVAVDQTSEERREVQLREYLGEIILSLRPRLKKTRHKIQIDCDDEIKLDLAAGPFSQVVTNLIMNSLIHGYDEGVEGEISMSGHIEGDFLIFRYADNGKGIAAENIKKIFDPFFTTKRGSGGSGLGLHILYNIVTQILGGTLDVRSEPGRGVEFMLSIPANIPAGDSVSA